jgi:hypothetical protein
LRQFLFFKALLLSGVITLAQSKHDRFDEYKKNADSLLTTIIDKGVFNKFVRFQANKRYYGKKENTGRKVSFSK